MARAREYDSDKLKNRKTTGNHEPGEAPEAEEAGGAASLPPEENRFMDDPNPDDASPEDLAAGPSSAEPSDPDTDLANDQGLSVKEEDRIGAGRGLDEAEMGRARPLDGKRWDDDPKKPYGTD